MKAQNISKELRTDQGKLNAAGISFQLSETKRSKGQPRGKKIRLVEQLDLDKLGQTINVSHYLSKQRGDKQNCTRVESRHRKRPTDERIHSTFRRRKNSSNGNQDNQQTRSKHQTRRSNLERLGKSLDYKRYLNKSMLPNKASKSQSCSPRKKSASKENKRYCKPFPTAKTRPSSVRTSSQTVTLSTLLNTKFNKTDNSNRLRELLNSMKNEEHVSMREILESSFETKVKDADSSVEKRESSRKLRTKKKSVQIRRKQMSTTISKLDVEEGLNAKNGSKAETKKFIRKKPLDEVYEDANVDDAVEEIIGNGNSFASDSLMNKVSSESHKESTPIYVQNDEQLENVKFTQLDDINFLEIRDFQHKNHQKLSARGKNNPPESHRNKNTPLLREVMARKIQRAWRKYRTRRLLGRYIDMFNADEDSEYEKTDTFDVHAGNGSEVLMRVGRRQIKSSDLESGQSEDLQGRQLEESIEQYKKRPANVPRLDIETEEFYQLKQSQHPKITVVSQISDLREQERQVSEAAIASQVAKYEQMIKTLRHDQLKKWSSIVQIISKSLAGSRSDIDPKDLLRKIAEQSEQNRAQLKQQVLKQPQESISISHYHSLDQQKSQGRSQSDPFEQFNSRKYKQLLDPTIVETLIKSRERFLSEREKTEKRLIEDKFETDQISIGSYKRNCERIDKWVNAQKVNIQKTRREIELGLGKAKQAIKKTQLDYVIMLKLRSSPSKPLHKCQSEEGLSRLRSSRRRPEDSISLTSSQHEYEQYMNNASFEEYEGENLDSNTDRLKQKLERLNQQERSPASDDSSEPQRILRRETNQPLHKLHFDLSEHNYSELCSLSDRDLEDGGNRITKILKEAIDPEKLSEQVCRQLFDEMIMNFLKDVSMQDTIIASFKRLRSAKLQKKRQKGIRTNIASVREYIKSLETFLFEKKIGLLKLLERPTGPTAREMLRYMHYYEDEQINEQEEVQNSILPNSVFQEHWKEIQTKIEFEPYYPQPDKQKARVEYLKGLTRIHYLAIFEAYNECLDQQRNFGSFGQPFPWKRTPNFFHQIRQSTTIKKSLDSVAKRINGIATSFCGIIFDRQDCTVQYSQQYIAQIQQDRVTRMLALQVMEGQHKWLFYDDEQTQILVQVAYLIGQALVNELVLQLHQMMFLR